MSKPTIHHIPACPFSQRPGIALASRERRDAMLAACRRRPSSAFDPAAALATLAAARQVRAPGDRRAARTVRP